LNTSATLNGVGNIDPKLKMNALKWYDEPKEKQISQLNSHRDKVEECHVQEKLSAINRWSIPFSQFPQLFLVSTSLFFNNLEEDNV